MGSANRWMRGGASVVAAACVSFLGRPAHAQGVPRLTLPPPGPYAGEPTLGPPPILWLGPPADARGVGTSAGSGVSIFAEPLRLDLFGAAPPIGGTIPGCAAPEQAGTATGSSPGFPWQRTAAIQLAPRLTLFGFSRGGCAVDGAIGGGIVFVQPLAKTVSLALGAGALYLPQQRDPRGMPLTKPAARADIVFDRGGGRSYNVGISTNGWSFGGVF